MGMFRLFSSSCYDKPGYKESVRQAIQMQDNLVVEDNLSKKNPNPSNFVIEKTFCVGEPPFQEYVVAQINYPDCTNYEGRKILVFKMSLDQFMNLKTIDPHFSSLKPELSPIARFVPTSEGWYMAVAFAKLGF